MLVSIPIAFLTPTSTQYLWLLVIPIGWVADRVLPS
jgi:hypothetical protein